MAHQFPGGKEIVAAWVQYKQLEDNMSQEFGFETDFGFDLPTAEDTNTALQNAFDESAADSSNFWGNAFDPAEVEATLKGELAPEGTYKSEGLQLEERANKFDGRPELSCYGSVVNAEGRRTKARFNLCPKKIMKDNGRPIWDYVLFSQAVTAYKVANGQPPSNPEEFKNFVATEGALEFRMVHNLKGTGLQVMGVKAVK